MAKEAGDPWRESPQTVGWKKESKHSRIVMPMCTVATSSLVDGVAQTLDPGGLVGKGPSACALLPPTQFLLR